MEIREFQDENNKFSLYNCDNLTLLKSIPDNHIDLIYSDILYGTGRDFKDYCDLKRSREEVYLHYVPRIKEMYRVLNETGTIYLQMSEEILHWVRCIMDDFFSYKRFLRQIYWKRSTNTGSSKARCKTFPNSVDVIICYSKSDDYKFNRKFYDYKEKTKQVFRHKDNRGYYRWQSLKTFSDERYEELLKQGMIKQPQKSKYPQYKQYLSESNGVTYDNNWQDISPVRHSMFFSQKPKELIKRIIEASSNENDLVADFYSGSFTTAEVCKENNRSFIGCDISPKAFEIGISRFEKKEENENAQQSLFQ